MQGLVTDRTQDNVVRRSELASKGWHGMTATERDEWLGSPLSETAVNLLPYAPYYSSVVSLKHTNDALIAKATAPGIYLYAVQIIGNASDFVNKTMTLSVDYIGTVDGASPQIAMYWHDGNGFEYAGASLTSAGSVTFNTGDNAGNREYLAMYIYVTTDASVEVGAAVRFRGVMLEFGDTRHDYVPYVEILPNDTTKGAYNYSDLNRVERTAAELSDLHGLNLKTKSDWGVWDVPKQDDMVRYLTNIRKIRQSCLNPNTEAAAPESMSGITYNDANNIEKILLAASENTGRIYRVGELFSGEVN
jgi:hypothetical protein